jgi:hypothetical protein
MVVPVPIAEKAGIEPSLFPFSDPPTALLLHTLLKEEAKPHRS